MDIRYVAFDSLGVKSSCTRLETGDCSIIIDPGIASETGSFPLTNEEKNRLCQEYEAKIREKCSSSEIAILTHYHYDHHIPDPTLYEGKTLLVKDPREQINKSQRRRAHDLLDGLDADIEIADGRTFTFGRTETSFSRPVWHGVDKTRLGYILMVTVRDQEEELLYTSDIDGPVQEEVTDTIIKENPDTLILDGPPTYLLGFITAYYNLARSILNICRIIEETKTELIILDHHPLRDYRYPELLHEVYKRAEELDRRVCTAAEIQGKRPAVLEGYARNGPTRWKNWTRFEKEDIIEVLKNAVEHDLIQKRWLKRARNL